MTIFGCCTVGRSSNRIRCQHRSQVARGSLLSIHSHTGMLLCSYVFVNLSYALCTRTATAMSGVSSCYTWRLCSTGRACVAVCVSSVCNSLFVITCSTLKLSRSASTATLRPGIGHDVGGCSARVRTIDSKRRCSDLKCDALSLCGVCLGTVSHYHASRMTSSAHTLTTCCRDCHLVAERGLSGPLGAFRAPPMTRSGPRGPSRGREGSLGASGGLWGPTHDPLRPPGALSRQTHDPLRANFRGPFVVRPPPRGAERVDLPNPKFGGEGLSSHFPGSFLLF
jgi:hypothetical protein